MRYDPRMLSMVPDDYERPLLDKREEQALVAGLDFDSDDENEEDEEEET